MNSGAEGAYLFECEKNLKNLFWMIEYFFQVVRIIKSKSVKFCHVIKMLLYHQNQMGNDLISFGGNIFENELLSHPFAMKTTLQHFHALAV